MSERVTIIGGSGFVGRYIARRMAKAGWRVRVAVRRPNEAIFVRTYGVVGQVEPMLCNIRDDASVRAAMTGAQAVVNCVGSFDKAGRNNYTDVQAEGAGRVARLAAELGLDRMVHISAIGADAASPSGYARTKAEGEAQVQAHMPSAVILRPSIVFGPEDQFFNRFAAMTRLGPFLPVVGADTRFQPVFVDDVAAAAEMGVLGTASPGIYELGGPDIETFEQLMRRMLRVIRRKRVLIRIPFGPAALMGLGFETLNTLSLGLIAPQITRDQVHSLKVDNVVAGDARGFGDLGISPTSMEAILPGYLYAFRPSGQYDAIKQSARNFRD